MAGGKLFAGALQLARAVHLQKQQAYNHNFGISRG